MTARHSLRFFWVLLRPSRALLALSLMLIGFAVRLASTDPGGFDQTFAWALMLQMFAASTGYMHAATSGYFDVMLSGQSDRMRVAAAHFAISILPGTVVWFLLALIEISVQVPHRTTALAPSALAAFAHVSAVVWTVTLRCRRYTGGGLWLAAIVVLAATHDLTSLRTLFGSAHDTWADVLSAAGAALVCPLIMVADAATADPAVVALVIGAAGVFSCVGLWTIARADLPLVEGFR